MGRYMKTLQTVIFWLAASGCLASIAIPLAVGLRALLIQPNLQHFADLVNKGQTLIAGFWASCLATIAGLLIWDQIRITKEIEAKRRLSRRTAQRSALPTILSPVSGYLKAVAGLLEDSYFELKDSPSTSISPVALPIIPAHIFTALRDTVEAEEGSIMVVVSLLLQELQILQARLETSLVNRRDRMIVTKHDLSARIVDVMIVQARVDSLYPYARTRVLFVNIKIDRAALLNASFVLLNKSEQVDDLYELVDARLAHSLTGLSLSLM